MMIDYVNTKPKFKTTQRLSDDQTNSHETLKFYAFICLFTFLIFSVLFTTLSFTIYSNPIFTKKIWYDDRVADKHNHASQLKAKPTVHYISLERELD